MKTKHSLTLAALFTTLLLPFFGISKAETKPPKQQTVRADLLHLSLEFAVNSAIKAMDIESIKAQYTEKKVITVLLEEAKITQAN